jgi:hypothetical protein
MLLSLPKAKRVAARRFPDPEQQPFRQVSKDKQTSWFEMAQERLLTIRAKIGLG